MGQAVCFTWHITAHQFLKISETNELHLVGGLEHDFYFPIYWECHQPNWLIFFRGVMVPTQVCCAAPWLSPRFGVAARARRSAGSAFGRGIACEVRGQPLSASRTDHVLTMILTHVLIRVEAVLRLKYPWVCFAKAVSGWSMAAVRLACSVDAGHF